MTDIQPFLVIVWGGEDRQPDRPALRLRFDTLQEALRVLDALEKSGVYRTGVLTEWRSQSGNYKLLAQFS